MFITTYVISLVTWWFHTLIQTIQSCSTIDPEMHHPDSGSRDPEFQGCIKNGVDFEQKMDPNLDQVQNGSGDG